MSTVDADADGQVDGTVDDAADDAITPGGVSDWDEEWLPDWVNVEDGVVAPDQPDPELDEQLAADLEAVERLVTSLLTESSAAFEASVGGWEPDDVEVAEEPKDPVDPEEPEPEPEPQPEPQRGPKAPPVPAVVSPPAPRRRRWGWLAAPLVLLLAGAVIGSLLWAGSARRPSPAAAIHAGAQVGTSSVLPTWTRPSDAGPSVPVPVTPTAASSSAPVTSVPSLRRAAPRPTARKSVAPTLAAPHLVAPSVPVAPPSPTVVDKGGDSTNGSGTPSCSSAATTTSTAPQTTEATSTSTDTTSATETSTSTSTTTDTTTQTLASQPPLGAAVGCSG